MENIIVDGILYKGKNSNMCLKHMLLRTPTLKFFIGFHIFTPFFVPKRAIGLDGIINYLG
jgi:hypothetical protein